MLGKDHVSITLGTVFPFTIPLIFSDNSQPLYAFCILVAAFIGSLIPDADSDEKPKLHYDFKIIYYIMVLLHKLIVFSFTFFNLKEKMNLQYIVEKQHRGVMHSPIGVFISSFVLTLLTTIISYFIFHEINATLIGFLFLGLISGQFLHLLEDSCTISGIKWLFPFGTWELKGSIYTGNKIDRRKEGYQAFFIQSYPIIFLCNNVDSTFTGNYRCKRLGYLLSYFCSRCINMGFDISYCKDR